MSACIAALAATLAIAGMQAQGPAPLPMSYAALPLAQAQDAGVAASPDVAAARARVAQARAALRAARWGTAPSGFGDFSETPQGGVGPQTVAAHQTAYGVQANLTDLLFGTSSQVRQADAALRAAVADESAAERAERVATTRIYFDALRGAATLAAREDALRLAQAELAAAQIRFHAGDVGRIDVVRAEVAVARAEADRDVATAQDANARDALRAETGATDDMLAATTGGAPPSVPALATDAGAAVALALRVSPEVREAAQGVKASAGSLGSARAAFLPPVTASSGFATGVDSGQAVAGHTVSIQVSVPLPFGPAAKISQASAALAEANARLAAVRRSVALETAAAARSLVAADRAAAATLRARDAALRALDAVELGYRAGATSGLEVAQARSTYAQAQLDLLSSVYDEAIAAAIFDVETGR